MVGTKDKQNFIVHLRPELTRDKHALCGKVFQPAQAASRFGQVIKPVPGAVQQGQIQWPDTVEGLL
jgi:hypothetical protein